MGRQKRTSKTLDKAQRRAAGLSSIDPSLDLGNGLTLANFSQQIQSVRQKQDAYNQALSTVDTLYNDLLAAEKVLADLNERMLTGAAARYGKDSSEYEQAGGTRKSERKPPTRKATVS